MATRSSRVTTVLVIGAVVLAAIWWTGDGVRRGKSIADAPVAVVAATAREGSFVRYESQPGTVTPANSVVVRSQVQGELKRIAFSGGQTVKQGELLAEVDPRSFQAQLQLANGDLARSQAQLANAQDTLKHFQTLLTQDSISRQRVADQQALVRQYTAEVASEQGRIGTARLQLASARITSPISGTVGLRRVDPGNLVGPSDARGIAVVTQSQPSKVVFSVPVNVAGRVLQRLRGADCIPVEVYADNPDDVLGSGHLLAANNQVDPETGTVKLEAEFANADGALLPNQFVTARLPVEVLPKATLVPAAAIQQGAQGAFVYVIAAGNTVQVVPVKLGPGDADTSVIASGIASGANVVIEGADRLRAGTKVKPTMRAAPTPANAGETTCHRDEATVSPRTPTARP